MATVEMSLTRVRILTALALVGVFALGGIAGGTVCRWMQPSTPTARPHPPFDPLGPLETLGLTADQKAQALKIIESHRPALEAVVRETFPRVREIQHTVEDELRAIMTPEQQKAFDAFRASHPPPPVFPPPPPGGPPPPPL